MLKVPPVTAPPPYTDDDVYAIQAVSEGRATPAQQKHALLWILEKAADVYGLSFRPGDTHATAFAEGRRFVGQQIGKLSKLNMATVHKIERENEARKLAGVKHGGK